MKWCCFRSSPEPAPVVHVMVMPPKPAPVVHVMVNINPQSHARSNSDDLSDVDWDGAGLDQVPAVRIQPQPAASTSAIKRYGRDQSSDFTIDFQDFDEERFAQKTATMSYFDNTVCEIAQVREAAEGQSYLGPCLAFAGTCAHASIDNPSVVRALAEIIAAKQRQIEAAHRRKELDDASYQLLRQQLNEMSETICPDCARAEVSLEARSEQRPIPESPSPSEAGMSGMPPGM